MTQRLDARLDRYTPIALSVFRIVFGLLFLLYGTSHAFGWPLDFGVPMGSWPVWWAGIIEFVAGALILLGLFTRIASFIASGHMAVAYFWQHQPLGLWPVGPPEMGGNGGTESILFCFGFLLLVFTGGGAYALDAARGRR